MKHVVYQGDVAPGEAVVKEDIKPLNAYRVKTEGGHYQVILTDEDLGPKKPEPKAGKK